MATLWTTSRAIAQPYLDAIEEGLRELGWVGGRNLVLEHRFTGGQPERLPALAAEVVAWKPDVAVAPLNTGALALKRLTSTMPIVVSVSFDPIGAGLAASLARPGGNVTGMTGAAPETSVKRLQMLRVHGLQELGRKLNAMSKAGQWDRMATEISDDVVRLFAAVGTHRELARAVAERFGSVVDTVALSGGYGTRQDLPPDLVQDIRRIPSVFTGYRTDW